MRRPLGDDSGYVGSPGSEYQPAASTTRSSLRQEYAQSTYSSRDTLTLSMDEVKSHQLSETFFSTPIICQFCKSPLEPWPMCSTTFVSGHLDI